jgi:hypothetical protein
MSKVVRSVKNVTKGYSSVQVKVRNGKLFVPSATQLQEANFRASPSMLPTNRVYPAYSYQQRPLGPNGHRNERDCRYDIQQV